MDELNLAPDNPAEAHPRVLSARLARAERALERIEERLARLEYELQAVRGDRQLKKAYSRYAGEELARLRKEVARLLRRVERLEGPVAKAQGGGVLEARSFDALVDEVAMEAVRRGAAVADAFAKAGHLRVLYAHDPAKASAELARWKDVVSSRPADLPPGARGLGEV